MHLTIVVAFMKVVYVALKWDNVQEQVHILYCVVLLILLSYCTCINLFPTWYASFLYRKLTDSKEIKKKQPHTVETRILKERLGLERLHWLKKDLVPGNTMFVVLVGIYGCNVHAYDIINPGGKEQADKEEQQHNDYGFGWMMYCRCRYKDNVTCWLGFKS